ncbi:MAG: hypothetical protein FWG64_01835 [Firmicutes bacterium]|nr:hypothetical protein [Bacillota bacterium]
MNYYKKVITVLIAERIAAANTVSEISAIFESLAEFAAEDTEDSTNKKLALVASRIAATATVAQAYEVFKKAATIQGYVVPTYQEALADLAIARGSPQKNEQLLENANKAKQNEQKFEQQKGQIL